MEYYSVIKHCVNMDKSLGLKDYLLYDFIYMTIWKRKSYRKGVGLRWLEEYDYRVAQENLRGVETLLWYATKCVCDSKNYTLKREISYT